jgi:Ca-activated chloride channel family protein
MHRRTLLSLVALLVLGFSLAAPALTRADGVVIVDPPPCDPACPEPINIGDQLEVKSHRVDVTIADQVATTKIDQVFHNPHDWVAQGTYVFPIPEGATIDNFTMVVDGEPVQAKILTADQARAIYDDIVRKLKDPALLEYVGRGAIQVSVFPIQPGADRRVQIQYRQVLTADSGLIRYVYPLNTERFSAAPLDDVSVHVTVASKDPIRAVYSPTHEIAVDRRDDTHFAAGWEASAVIPNTDFELIYTVSADAIGANLLSYWDPVAQEGTFLLLAAPGINADQAAVAKDVIVVLDTSGSMEGEKIEQAKTALTYVLQHLNPEDRFNIVEFSTGVRTYASDLQPATAAPDAVNWVSRLQATGGTDINRALLETMAMAKPERPTYVLFLTDGLPTEGETEIPAILNNVKQSAPANVRLFAFGVGDDVDTVLLDSLVQDHHGSSAYVRPGERLDEAVSAFYARVSTPVLTDVNLKVDGVTVDEVYPQPLPDIFAGTQLVVVGKYRTGGPAKLTLTGNVNGQAQTYAYDGRSFTSSGGDEFLPRLWATRKIGYLLNQIRLHGENDEWVKAIVDLSVRYGIVTPYTSYLVTDDNILTQEGRDNAAARAAATATSAPSSGAGAVDEAQAAGDMAQANAAPAPTQNKSGDGGNGNGSGGSAVRVVGNRTFLLQNGVWIETTFDPSTTTTTKLQFAGDDYFKLLDLYPDLAAAFSLGNHVIALSHGHAFEVTPDPQPPIDFSTLPA